MNRFKDEGAMSIRGGSPVGLVAAATATAAAASAAGEASRRRGRAGAVPGCREDGKLDRGFLAGALGAGDFLLLVDDDLLEVFLAVFADVFVDGHGVLGRGYRTNYSNLCLKWGIGGVISNVPASEGGRYRAALEFAVSIGKASGLRA